MSRKKLACEYRRKQRRSDDQVHASAPDQMHRSCGRRETELHRAEISIGNGNTKSGLDYDCYYKILDIRYYGIASMCTS